MARRRFFVSEVRNHRAELAGEEALHLTRVLRVERGQRYEISDNRAVYLAEVEEAHRNRVVFAVVGELAPREAPVRLTLMVALIRFDRLEWVLEKGTELDVERFLLVEAERSERGLEKAAPKRIERWERILRETSQQCRRDRLPALGGPAPLEEALAWAADFRYRLEEAEGAPPAVKVLPAERRSRDAVAVLVGPEGGWTERERRMAGQAGWQAVSLGPQILRAETAAIAAAALVQNVWLP